MSDPKGAYVLMKGDLQRVLALPLEGKEELFRDVLVGYLMMSVLVYVTTFVTGEFKISYGKLGPTEIRVIAILATVAFFFGGVTFFVGFVGCFALTGLTSRDA